MEQAWMITLANGFNICAVAVESIPAGWPIVEPMLREALAFNQGTSTAEDVYVALQEQKAVLWIAEKNHIIHAAAVTEVVDYPRGQSLRVWLLAGRQMELWKEGIAIFEDYARRNGCRFIEALTRRGMEKLTRDLGFETKFIWSIKPIDLRTH